MHSPKCEAHQQLGQQRIAEFDAQHPNACPRCGGAGGRTIPGGYWDPPDYDECPECLSLGKCPLCMEDLTEKQMEDGEHTCGWSMGHSPIRPEYECICYDDLPEVEYPIVNFEEIDFARADMEYEIYRDRQFKRKIGP